MSAPKPELTAELRAVIEKYRIPVFDGVIKLDDVVREVVEIVARKSADIADQAIAQDASGYASTAILSHWGLK